MKLTTFFFAFFSLLLCFSLQAQAPQTLNYQAIARNPQGQPYADQSVSVQFSILDGSAGGMAIYTETHAAQTNQFGLFTLAIGGGVPMQGSFAAIDWGSGSKFLKVDIDGVLQGTTQMQSVPYAIFAEKTKLTAGNGIAISGNTITNNGDLSATNELQNLSLTGSTLAISNGNSVSLPAANAYTAGAGIAVSGNTITNTSLNTDAQTLSLTGNSLGISGGNSVSLPAATAYTAGTGIGISGTTITNTAPSKWNAVGSSIFYNTGKVLVGIASPLNSNSTTLLQVGSATTEAALFMAGKGGSNHSSIALGEFGTDKNWAMAFKSTANGGINRMFSIDYQDGLTTIDDIFKLTPTGNTALGYDYNQTPPASKLSVKGGDINIIDVGKGVIMKSPNGNCWRMTVSNVGQPVFTAITCP